MGGVSVANEQEEWMKSFNLENVSIWWCREWVREGIKNKRLRKRSNNETTSIKEYIRKWWWCVVCYNVEHEKEGRGTCVISLMHIKKNKSFSAIGWSFDDRWDFFWIEYVVDFNLSWILDHFLNHTITTTTISNVKIHLILIDKFFSVFYKNDHHAIRV
jgi:predicted CDP-diglyceride synthetase/phosphatidate cytidylyltransferase